MADLSEELELNFSELPNTALQALSDVLEFNVKLANPLGYHSYIGRFQPQNVCGNIFSSRKIRVLIPSYNRCIRNLNGGVMRFKFLLVLSAACAMTSCASSSCHTSPSCSRTTSQGYSTTNTPTIQNTVEIPVVQTQTTRQVLDRPATTQERVIPAVTRMQSQRVIKTPESTVERTLPAITRQVERIDPQTGERTTEVVIVRPQATEYVTIPAVYETVTETVVVQEASTEIVSIPAVYRTIVESAVHPTKRFSWSLDADNKLPYFNPPSTDEKRDIDNEFFKKNVNGRSVNPTLRDVYEAITNELSQDPLLSYEYRVFKYRNGFAILTDPERIRKSGAVDLQPNGERVPMNQRNARSLGAFFRALLRPPENRYRYIAFIVTLNNYIESSPQAGTPGVLKAKYESGGTNKSLPLGILEHFEFDDDYRVQVRIYEFPSIKRASRDSGVRGNSLNSENDLDTYNPRSFFPTRFRDHLRNTKLLKRFFP